MGAVAVEPEPVEISSEHIHTFNEDLSHECDGVKTEFIVANEFEPDALYVHHNGHLLRPGSSKDFTELPSADGFTVLLAAPPNPNDTLTCAYLVRH
jgi:hypothetical protein